MKPIFKSSLLLVLSHFLVSCSLFLELPDEDSENANIDNGAGGRDDGVNEILTKPDTTSKEGDESAGAGGTDSQESEPEEEDPIDPPCTVDCECKTTCDCDEDGAFAKSCGGDDCDDYDADVYPGQSEFFAERSANPAIGFDYDCNEKVEGPPENISVNCSGLTLGLCNDAQGFLTQVPACGKVGKWGVCVSNGLSCQDKVIDDEKMALCH